MGKSPPCLNDAGRSFGISGHGKTAFVKDCIRVYDAERRQHYVPFRVVVPGLPSIQRRGEGNRVIAHELSLLSPGHPD